MDLAHALWIGGPQGSGTRDVAGALADRFDLRLYSVEREAAAHAPRMPIVGDSPPATTARHRFRLVLEDLRELDGSGVIVEGAELLPTSVSAVLRSPDQAIFLLPDDAGPFAWEARDLRLRVLDAHLPLEELVQLAAEHFAPVVERMVSA